MGLGVPFGEFEKCPILSFYSECLLLDFEVPPINSWFRRRLASGYWLQQQELQRFDVPQYPVSLFRLFLVKRHQRFHLVHWSFPLLLEMSLLQRL
jgi:hypothetical protein